MKNYFTVLGDDGAEEVFDWDELNLEKDKEYSYNEIIEALIEEGYSERGIISIT